MNTMMWNHPATKESIVKLKSWGIEILSPAEGILACGEIGAGKLVSPSVIVEAVENSLNIKIG